MASEDGRDSSIVHKACIWSTAKACPSSLLSGENAGGRSSLAEITVFGDYPTVRPLQSGLH